MLDQLNKLMLKRGINKSQLSKESGIPYTTIDGFYKKGTDNAKLSTLKKLSNYFEVPLDYWANKEVDKLDLEGAALKVIELAEKINEIGNQEDIEFLSKFLYELWGFTIEASTEASTVKSSNLHDTELHEAEKHLAKMNILAHSHLQNKLKETK